MCNFIVESPQGLELPLSGSDTAQPAEEAFRYEEASSRESCSPYPPYPFPSPSSSTISSPFLLILHLLLLLFVFLNFFYFIYFIIPPYVQIFTIFSQTCTFILLNIKLSTFLFQPFFFQIEAIFCLMKSTELIKDKLILSLIRRV